MILQVKKLLLPKFIKSISEKIPLILGRKFFSIKDQN